MISLNIRPLSALMSDHQGPYRPHKMSVVKYESILEIALVQHLTVIDCSQTHTDLGINIKCNRMH